MLDETDIKGQVEQHYETLGRRAVEALRRNMIGAQYVPDEEQARSTVIDMIPEGCVVGIGDSVTLHQLSIVSYLQGSSKYQVLNPFMRDPDGNLLMKPQERYDLFRKSLLTDVYITGTNAITLDGKLVNVDGNGNRVAAMMYGPHKVIIVAGANKIVKDEVGARQRIKEICAPVNALRHLEKHRYASMAALPCVKTGSCADCKVTERICCFTVIIEYQRGYQPQAGDAESEAFAKATGTQRINVVLVGKSLGL